MKDFLIIWFIAQIFTLSFMNINGYYDIRTDNFDCSIYLEEEIWTRVEYNIIALVIPLVVFVDDSKIDKYCELDNRNTYKAK